MSKEESEIFVPADRHYPDGFRILVSGDSGSARNLAFRWDASRSRAVVSEWGPVSGEQTLKIVPSVRD